MISRVAEHCFWLGRYLERTENTARVLHVTGNLALDAELTKAQVWGPVVIVFGEEGRFLEKYGPSAMADGELVQRHLTWAEDNPSSLSRSTFAARDNARSIREVLSLETFEAVNELYLYVAQDASKADFERDRVGFYRRVRNTTQLALGLMRSTMLHDTPLDFIWLGVMLERVGQTARTLDVQYHALSHMTGANAAHQQVIETALWLSLLRACSGFEPYLKRSRGGVSGASVAEFLIHESQFPRSVRYCVHAAYDRLCQIRPPDANLLPGGMSLERLRQLDSFVSRPLEGHTPTHVHDLLTHVVDETAAICGEIGRELLGYESPDVVARRSSRPPPA